MRLIFITRRFTIFYIKAIWLSLFSRDIYRDAAFKWKGLGIIYILILTSITIIPVTIKAKNKIDGIFAFQSDEQESLLPRRIKDIILQIPKLTIKSGKISADQTAPISIIDPKSESVIAIIDTKNTMKSFTKTKATVIVTSHGVIIKEGKYQQMISASDLSSLLNPSAKKEVIIDQKSISLLARQSLEKSGSLPLMIFFAKTSSSTIVHIIQAFLMALVGLFFCQMAKIRPDFAMLVRLSAVAMTPFIIIEAITLTIGVKIFSNENWVYFTIHAMYLYFAIESLRGAKNEKLGEL